MSQIRAITINDVQYNVAQASAVEQKKIMLHIGAKIAFNSATTDTVEIDSIMLFGLLMSLPESTFDEISNVVLRKAFIAGTDTQVTLANFQGSMTSYFKLVAEAIVFNLGDYFTWLDSENAARRAQVKGGKA